MNTYASGRKSIRVLVVDDYPNVADSLANVLREKEYTAIPVHSGEEAMRVAEQFMPHVLIADVMMLEVNGVDLVCTFAENFPTCRPVLMTAKHWPEELSIGELQLKVFHKPFDIEQLFEFLAST
jgi:DNA-binding response OmpR family regulator